MPTVLAQLDPGLAKHTQHNQICTAPGLPINQSACNAFKTYLELPYRGARRNTNRSGVDAPWPLSSACSTMSAYLITWARHRNTVSARGICKPVCGMSRPTAINHDTLVEPMHLQEAPDKHRKIFELVICCVISHTNKEAKGLA